MNVLALRDDRVRFTSGSIESLKWLALVCMAIDHVNVVFFARSLPWAAPVGRLAMPIFAVVLAYNLARRPGQGLGKVFQRLVLFGALAAPFHAHLFHTGASVLPLNIMATFAVAVGVLWLLERARDLDSTTLIPAFALLIAGSMLVEYGLPGVGLVVAAYTYFTGRRGAIWNVLICLVALYVPNGNAWALLVLPVLWLASRVDVNVPRLRWFFWAFYPVHLAALTWLVGV